MTKSELAKYFLKYPLMIDVNGVIYETSTIDLSKVNNGFYWTYNDIEIAFIGDTKEELLKAYHELQLASKKAEEIKSHGGHMFCTTECWSCSRINRMACEMARKRESK